MKLTSEISYIELTSILTESRCYMKILQLQFTEGKWTTFKQSEGFDPGAVQLVLAFGSCAQMHLPETTQFLKDKFPKGQIVWASTAGEILGDHIIEESIAVTAIQFEKTQIKCSMIDIHALPDSESVGVQLMSDLTSEDLKAIFVLAEGTFLNGSDFVAGINKSNPTNIPITGGLAGDGPRFEHTYIGLNDVPMEAKLVGIGFYGDHFSIGHASMGGWDEFGPTRTITKSNLNILYEIDGRNALELYKEYLGPYSQELPGSALLFPLNLRLPGEEEGIVRTILSIDEKEQSMRFAGNLPEGSSLRLMKANFERLIEASSEAARISFDPIGQNPELAIMISCVGRKLILQERTLEEVQAATQVFGNSTFSTGFYSYGEISPFKQDFRCELHNQTMTITSFSEL